MGQVLEMISGWLNAYTRAPPTAPPHRRRQTKRNARDQISTELISANINLENVII